MAGYEYKLVLRSLADVAEEVAHELDVEGIWPQTRVVVWERQAEDGSTFFEWDTLGSLKDPGLVKISSFGADFLARCLPGAARAEVGTPALAPQ